MPNHISTEARIAVRHFKRQIDERSARVHEVVTSKSFDQLTQAYMFKTGKGMQRALDRLHQLMPAGATLELAQLRPRRLLWSQLCCTPHLLKQPNDPGECQDAVCLEYILAHFPDNQNAMRVQSGVWTLEVPDHALGRLFQRRPGIDGAAALRHVHNMLQGTKLDKLPNREHSIYIDAPGGVFVGNVITATFDQDLAVYYRARTYLGEDQLWENQVPLGQGTPNWGSTILLPAPLLAELYRHSKRLRGQGPS